MFIKNINYLNYYELLYCEIQFYFFISSLLNTETKIIVRLRKVCVCVWQPSSSLDTSLIFIKTNSGFTLRVRDTTVVSDTDTAKHGCDTL